MTTKKKKHTPTGALWITLTPGVDPGVRGCVAEHVLTAMADALGCGDGFEVTEGGTLLRAGDGDYEAAESDAGGYADVPTDITSQQWFAALDAAKLQWDQLRAAMPMLHDVHAIEVKIQPVSESPWVTELVAYLHPQPTRH